MVGSNSSQGPSSLPSAAATSTSSGDESETIQKPKILPAGSGGENKSRKQQNAVHERNLPPMGSKVHFLTGVAATPLT